MNGVQTVPAAIRIVRMNMHLLCHAALITLLLSHTPARAAPEIPGEDQKQPIALVGGTIHVVSGPAVEKGMLLFDKGKIVAVGPKVAIPKGAKQVDMAGKHVYPG